MFDSVNFSLLHAIKNLQGGHFYWDTVYSSSCFRGIGF